MRLPSAKEFLLRWHSLVILILLLGNCLGFHPIQLRRLHSIPSSSAQYDVKTNAIRRSSLFGKRKTNDPSRGTPPSISSILQILPFPKSSRDKKIESGVVETALVLGNKQRRDEWIKEAGTKFGWIPPETLSACADGLASAFCAVAPKDLKNALKPGGLESVRSKIGSKVVRNLKEQPIVQSLPLPKDDKNKLVEYLVDLSLDFFLKDLEETLAAPSTKLAALDREKREILQYMSLREIFWYNLKYKPRSTLGWGLFSLWSVGVTVWFVQQNRSSILMGMQQITASLLVAGQQFLSSSLSFLSGAVVQGISYLKSLVSKYAKKAISWRR